MRFPGFRGSAARGTAVLAAGTLAAGLAVTPAASADPAPDCPITGQVVSAGNYWVANGPNQASADWQNATFNVGNLALVRTTGVSNHKTLPWASANNYQLPADSPGKPFFPDNEAVGEAYFDLHDYFHPETPMTSLRDRITAEMASVQAGHDDYWNYVDALNMAMPSFARLAKLDNNPAILDTMQTLFHYTEKQAGGHGLFNEYTGLWYRDARFVNTGVFWSRGNGWAIAALAKVLQVLPSNDPRRAEYTRVFKKMAFTLSNVQRPDGFWNSDLLNPRDHGGPESSGTSLFTYAIGWGVYAGILDQRRYEPVVNKAWKALSTKALQPSGLVGYVQPVGAQPGPATATDTSAFGVGAFLSAGQQVARLQGCSAN